MFQVHIYIIVSEYERIKQGESLWVGQDTPE